jgi:hypothetical protein
MSTSTSNGLPDVRCRADFGISVGFSAVRDLHEISTIAQLPPGPVGISVTGQPFRIEAVALYRFQPGVACPPAEVR